MTGHPSLRRDALRGPFRRTSTWQFPSGGHRPTSRGFYPKGNGHRRPRPRQGPGPAEKNASASNIASMAIDIGGPTKKTTTSPAPSTTTTPRAAASSSSLISPAGPSSTTNNFVNGERNEQSLYRTRPIPRPSFIADATAVRDYYGERPHLPVVPGADRYKASDSMTTFTRPRYADDPSRMTFVDGPIQTGAAAGFDPADWWTDCYIPIDSSF